VQVDIKKINAAKSEVTLTIDADQAGKEYRAYFNKSAGMIQVPGFRKGKAPITMVERSHGARIRELFMEMMTEKSFREAVREHNIEFLYMPEVTKIDWEYGTDMTINLKIEREPQIEFKQLEGLTVPYQPHALEKDVEHYLTNLQRKSKTMVEADDNIQANDIVELELRKVSGNEGDFWKIDVQMEDIQEMPWEPLVGKMIGDSVELELSADLFRALTQAAGVDVSDPDKYIGMVNAIRRERIPEIDDEFAKDYEFTDLAEMKTKIGEELALQNEQKGVRIKQNSVLTKLLRDNPFELPDKVIDYLVEQEIQKYSQIKDAQFRQYFEYQIRKEIIKDMVMTYLLDNLIAQYPCEVSDEDRDAYIKHLAILADTTVEAWKDKNQELFAKEEFIKATLVFTILSKIAATCDFVEKEDEPEEEADDEYEVLPDEPAESSHDNEDMFTWTKEEEA